MMDCDLFGFKAHENLVPQGIEMPRPFIMKHLSRVALSCRNPLMTGNLLTILSPLLYPCNPNGLSFSRLQCTLLFALGTLMGVYFEQREVQHAIGVKAYQKYCSVIKNAIVPDLRVLFWDTEDIL
jgi:hypothetical protein